VSLRRTFYHQHTDPQSAFSRDPLVSHSHTHAHTHRSRHLHTHIHIFPHTTMSTVVSSVCLFALVCLCAASPSLHSSPATYTNPVIDGNHPDPGAALPLSLCACMCVCVCVCARHAHIQTHTRKHAHPRRSAHTLCRAMQCQLMLAIRSSSPGVLLYNGTYFAVTTSGDDPDIFPIFVSVHTRPHTHAHTHTLTYTHAQSRGTSRLPPPTINQLLLTTHRNAPCPLSTDIKGPRQVDKRGVSATCETLQEPVALSKPPRSHIKPQRRQNDRQRENSHRERTRTATATSCAPPTTAACVPSALDRAGPSYFCLCLTALMHVLSLLSLSHHLALTCTLTPCLLHPSQLRLSQGCPRRTQVGRVRLLGT